MIPNIDKLVESLEICLPDNIPNLDNVTSYQKLTLLSARRYVDNYDTEENKKDKLMVNGLISLLRMVGESNYKKLANILLEFVDHEICHPCEESHEKCDCENCNMDWNIYDLRNFAES